MKFIAIVWPGVLRAAQARLHQRESRLHEHDQEAGDQGPHEVDRDAVVADGVRQFHRQRLDLGLACSRPTPSSRRRRPSPWPDPSCRRRSGPPARSPRRCSAWAAWASTAMPVAVPAGSGLGSSASNLVELAAKKSAAARRAARRHVVLRCLVVMRIGGYFLFLIVFDGRRDAGPNTD